MKEISRRKIRPAAADQFYPDDKKKLTKMIDELLSAASPQKFPGEVFGLMLPHASYGISGRVAAEGIKAIFGEKFDTVVIIGDSHYEYFDGVSVWPAGGWETPLGTVKIDAELTGKILAKSDRIFKKDSAHIFEHSIEVQLPFLQRILGEFKIAPIIIGSENKDWNILSEALLRQFGKKRILIIASSDLSHYPSCYDAQKADKETLTAIMSLDTLSLDKKLSELKIRKIPNAETFLCANDSVKTLMELARSLSGRAKILKYANSGDLPSGGKLKTVGYGAMVFLI